MVGMAMNLSSRLLHIFQFLFFNILSITSELILYIRITIITKTQRKSLLLTTITYFNYYKKKFEKGLLQSNEQKNDKRWNKQNKNELL